MSAARHVMTREQIRAYDAYAIGTCRVPGLVLMENAGRGAADIVERLLSSESGGAGGAAVVVCGRGNNGGDGFVVARHLAARGHEARVFLVGAAAAVAGDARSNLEALTGLGVAVVEIDGGGLGTAEGLAQLREALAAGALCVDALFGTGLARPLDGLARDVVLAINDAPCPCVALDVPSGIDADRGAVLGAAVQAAVTITFAHLKTGLLQGAGLDCAGEIECVGLGVPDEDIVAAVGSEARLIGPHDVARGLGARAKSAHKYRAGSVLVVAGSAGKTGAALLAAKGALRAGAGLATVATWPEAADRIDGRELEVMTTRLDRARLDATLAEALAKRAAVAVGPGLGLDGDARRVADAVALGCTVPAVVDADALSHFAGRPDELRRAAGARVLTPHAGELARLLGIPSAEVDGDRFGLARRAAERTGAVVVLKGPYTIVAHPDGRRLVCDVAEPLLATAGAGDVLSGVIAALLATASSADLEAALVAAAAGVQLHARAAQLWNEGRDADRGLVAGDLCAELPRAIAELV